MSDTYRQVGISVVVGSDWKRVLSREGGFTAEYTRTGMRDALEAIIPAEGATIETISGVAMIVRRSVLTDGDGGSATLVVSAAQEISGGASVEDPDPLGPPEYTIEFQELRKKLETHYKCGLLTLVDSSRTWENWAELEDADYDDDVIPSVTWTLAEYKALKAAGVEEYLEYWPIIRRTLYYNVRPDDIGTASGKIQTPPSGVFADVADFEWLCGPDSFTREGGKFRRETMWMGAKTVSTDLYETA